MKTWRAHGAILGVLALGCKIVLIAGIATGGLYAQEPESGPTSKTQTSWKSSSRLPQEAPHPFWDKTNLMLFAGVAAVRGLDYSSTQHFRSRGHNEVLFNNNIVDNKPLFAGIEVGGTALSIGLSYWLHRTGHHKLERWVSVIHIGVGAFGDIHNYSLKAQP